MFFMHIGQVSILLSSFALLACTAAPKPAATKVPSSTASAASSTSVADGKRLSACSAAEHRRFDFWIGSWEVRSTKGVVVGKNTIESRHRGCALIETWTSAKDGTGSSMNYWSSEKHAWMQLWRDDSAGVVELQGGLVDGAMKLAGRYIKSKGAVSRLRGTWTPLGDGRVR